MGIPKLFSHIAERYPNISELVGSNDLPPIDNLYLDVNDIIHTYSNFFTPEEQVFRNVLQHIDLLLHFVQPKKLFFLAVDGVATRGKLRQQRGGRFDIALQMNEIIGKTKLNGDESKKEILFDKNCISPGTIFMERLHEELRHFIKRKMSTDLAWRKCRVILSGHDVPGEGEHKMMDYIRFLKSKPDYDPNTRHCFSGADADLIMLALSTHERHFCILRESMKFGKVQKYKSVDHARFTLLHIGLLRDYLELEFLPIRNDISFDFSIEHIIDDWILMCFMIGNDFIPHSPYISINMNALTVLNRAYMSVLPQLDGYINEHGKLNLARLEIFMAKLGEFERKMFILKKMFKARENQNLGTSESRPENVEKEMDNDNENDKFPEGAEDDNLAQGDQRLLDEKFQQYKKEYYVKAMSYADVNDDILAEETKCYITALQWTLNCYYRNVCSWSWFYPHCYAPWITDIKNFKDMNIEFGLSKPCLPFELLLAILPAESKELLPKAYHKLMTDPTSKLAEYFVNGIESYRLNRWIDDKKLIEAMNECNDDLTESEHKRNVHGPMLQYDYTPIDQGPLIDSPFGHVGTAHTFFIETPVARDEIHVDEDKMIFGASKNPISNEVYFPGSPRLKGLDISVRFAAIRVKVFYFESQGKSIIIRIDEPPIEQNLDELAKHFIGKEIYIGWPHMKLAKVIGVSDVNTKITEQNGKSDNSKIDFILDVRRMKNHLLQRMGIELGKVTQLLNVVPLENHEYIHTNDGQMTLSKNWSRSPVAVAPNTIIENLRVHEKDVVHCRSVESVFTKGSTVFLMNNSDYGSQGTITDSKLIDGRLKISLSVRPKPDFSEARRIQRKEIESYTDAHSAATSISVGTHLFSIITGHLWVIVGEKKMPLDENVSKVNIGLQLKSAKRNNRACGYLRYENRHWLYSKAAIDLVDSYRNRFPGLFLMLQRNMNSQDPIFESDLNAGRQPEEMINLKDVAEWLNEQPHKMRASKCCDFEFLEHVAVRAIVAAVNETKSLPVRRIRAQVKPQILYMPNLNEISVEPDIKAEYKLFDRVVIVRDGYVVPLGWHGTIIDIHELINENPIQQEPFPSVEYLYEVLFDEAFDGGQSIDSIVENRIYIVRRSVLINITFGLARPKIGMQTHDPALSSTVQPRAPHLQQQNAVRPQLVKSNPLQAFIRHQEGLN